MENLCKQFSESIIDLPLQTSKRKSTLSEEEFIDNKKVKKISAKNFYIMNISYWNDKSLIEAFTNNFYQGYQGSYELDKEIDLACKVQIEKKGVAGLSNLNLLPKKTSLLTYGKNLVETCLPKITQDMMDEIEVALKSSNNVMASAFGLQVTKADYVLLKELDWLSDEILNFYMDLINARSSTKGFPSVHAMNTFFYKKLKDSNYLSVQKWTRKVDIFSKDFLIIPIHSPSHWGLCVINFQEKSTKYYDSYYVSDDKGCLKHIRNI